MKFKQMLLMKIIFVIDMFTFLIPLLGAECPKINDLPVLNSAGNNFYCAFDWIDSYPWTHEIPLEACNDKRYNLMDGTDWDTGHVHWFKPIGGLIVKAGCTLYGYQVYFFLAHYNLLKPI